METVLNFRQRLEDIAKNNLAAARQAERQAYKQYQHARKDHEQLVIRIEHEQNEGIRIVDLIMLEEHRAQLRSRVEELKQELDKRREQVSKMQEELLTRSRERQVMDKLKERQNRAYRLYLEKKEAAALDEIAIIYHNK